MRADERGITQTLGSRHQDTAKTTGQPFRNSEHRPSIVEMQPLMNPPPTKQMPRLNFRKANCEGFTTDLENSIDSIPSITSEYESLQSLEWRVAE